MATSNHLTPGMTLSIQNKLYRVESSVKVTAPKGQPFIKTKLRNLETQKVSEKNFKLNQSIKDVQMKERALEYLYMEGKDFLFLDVGNLDQHLVLSKTVGDTAHYLKEGVPVTASFFEEKIYSVDLPHFLELMVGGIEGEDEEQALASASRMAILETGAKIEVPPFIESGDIIKVDTRANEYVQRI